MMASIDREPKLKELFLSWHLHLVTTLEATLVASARMSRQRWNVVSHVIFGLFRCHAYVTLA